MQTELQTFECCRNLERLYQDLAIYKQRHAEQWPTHSGVGFFLCLYHDPLFEPTEESVARLFCPALRACSPEYAEAIDDPQSWLPELKTIRSKHSNYAGRDQKPFPLKNNLELEVILADDNEDGSNHRGSMCLLFATGQAKEMSYARWATKKLIPAGAKTVRVGPDSPINTPTCSLIKLKLD